MKKIFLFSVLMGALPLSMTAQDDDLYFVPKKKSAEKTTDAYGMPKDTYYSGSTRSVDKYNRRSHYEVIGNDSTSDIIRFDAVKGVYPDSLQRDSLQGGEDYALTKKMQRFDGYDITANEAFWAGYRAGREDSPWGWHSPWYYGRYGWYGGWYDPWYYDRWRWADPWYWDYAYWPRPWYGGWYGGWYYGGWYGGWYYGRPYYYSYGGGVARAVRRNGNSGSINMYSGGMNGRVYRSSNGGRSGGYSSSRSSLRSRMVGGHTAYDRSGATRQSASRNTYTPSRSTTYSGGSFSSGGGFSGGGGRVGGGGFSGGGGRAGGGGHTGSRR